MNMNRFDDWMNEVNSIFSEELTSDDFDDWLWNDRFREGLTPRDAYELWWHTEFLH